MDVARVDVILRRQRRRALVQARDWQAILGVNARNPDDTGTPAGVAAKTPHRRFRGDPTARTGGLRAHRIEFPHAGAAAITVDTGRAGVDEHPARLVPAGCLKRPVPALLG